MSEIDYLNDPLLATPDERPRAERTPLLERAAEVLAGMGDGPAIGEEG